MEGCAGVPVHGSDIMSDPAAKDQMSAQTIQKASWWVRSGLGDSEFPLGCVEMHDIDGWWFIAPVEEHGTSITRRS